MEARTLANDARKAFGELEAKGKADKEQLKEMQAAAGDKQRRLHADMPTLVDLIAKNKAKYAGRCQHSI